MSFIRPEIRAALLRWREVWISAALVLIGIWVMGHGVDRNSIILTACGILLIGLFTVSMFGAILRAKLSKPGEAAGVVEVKEREIGYLTPDGGAFVSLDDLTQLDIITTDQGPGTDDVFWILTHRGGAPMMIPASAKGADQLFDAFSALKGINFEQVIMAMSSTENNRFQIWQRPGLKIVPQHP